MTVYGPYSNPKYLSVFGTLERVETASVFRAGHICIVYRFGACSIDICDIYNTLVYHFCLMFGNVYAATEDTSTSS